MVGVCAGASVGRRVGKFGSGVTLGESWLDKVGTGRVDTAGPGEGGGVTVARRGDAGGAFVLLCGAGFNCTAVAKIMAVGVGAGLHAATHTAKIISADQRPSE